MFRITEKKGGQEGGQEEKKEGWTTKFYVQKGIMLYMFNIIFISGHQEKAKVLQVSHYT